MKTKTLFASLALGLLMAVNVSAFTMTLDVPNSKLSSYPPPYAQVEITDFSSPSATATVRFTSLLSGSYFYDIGGNTIAALNVDAASFTAAIFSWGGSTTIDPDKIEVKYNETNSTSEFGQFNLDINAKVKGDPADWFAFTLTNNAGFWSSAADVLKINDAGYLAAAHIYVNGTDVTGYAGNGGETPVPEPGTIVLLGAGLFGLGIFSRRRLSR